MISEASPTTLPHRQFTTQSTNEQILEALQHRHYEIAFSTRITACDDPEERIRAVYIPAYNCADYEPINFHPTTWNDILSRFARSTDACLLIQVEDPDEVCLALKGLQAQGLMLTEAVGYWMNLANQIH